MLYTLTRLATVHFMFVLFIRSSSTDESNSVHKEIDTTSLGSKRTLGGINATERTSNRLDTSTVSSVNNSDALENVFNGPSHTKLLNDKMSSENITLDPEKYQNNSRYDIETIDDGIDEDTGLTVDAFAGALTTQDTNVQTQKADEKSYHKIVKIPYQIHSDISKIQTLSLNNGQTRIALQHHLQLVPMEDEPFGAMMAQDQRYMISVLAPIAIGMIGATLIVGTVFTLRYVARKRVMHHPIDDEAEVQGCNTPSISSISAETTDKMFLLLGDDEI